MDCRLEPLFSRSGFVLGPGKRGALCRYAEKSKHLRDKTLLRGEYSRCSPIAEMREGSQGGIELMFRGRDFGTADAVQSHSFDLPYETKLNLGAA